MFTTFVRPDPAHPSVVAGMPVSTANWFGATHRRTREPDGQPWPEGGQVPLEDRAGLVAVFNSGFKMASAHVASTPTGGRFANYRMGPRPW